MVDKPPTRVKLSRAPEGRGIVPQPCHPETCRSCPRLVLRLMLYYHYDDGKEKAMSVFALVVLAGIAALVVTIIGAIIITVLLLKRNQDRE